MDIEKLRVKGRIGKRKTFFETIRVDLNGTIAIATYTTLVKVEPATYNLLFTRVFRYDRTLKLWLISREHF